MTPYQKRLKEVQEEMAKPLRFHFNTMEQAIEAMLPLAIRQIQREAEAVKIALNYYWYASADYLKQNGYAE